MSEKITSSPENQERFEVKSSAERSEHKARTTGEKPQEHDKEKIENLRHNAEVEAKSSKEISIDKVGEKNATDHYMVTKELKAQALKRGLTRARKHLSSADKAFSKLIHQPVVDGLSAIGEKTIARPKGILTGSILALAGSSYVLFSAKHYGYVYNYWIVFVLFAGGYLAGLAIELLFFAFKRSSRQK